MKKLAVVVVIGFLTLSVNASAVETPKTDEVKTFKDFFTKGKVNGYYRAIYFNRDFKDGPDAGFTKDRAVFANGGGVHLSTAPYNKLSGNIGFYTVQDFGWNDDQKNTELRTLFHENGSAITSHQNTESFSVLGEYFIQGKWAETTARIGSIELWKKWKTPWLHSWDFRVIPANYQGLFIQNQSVKNLKVFLSPYIWGFRDNNEKKFIAPAEHLTGNNNDDDGISLLGLTYTGIDKMKLQGWYQHHWNVTDNTMVTADYRPKLSDKVTLIMKGLLQTQSNVGDSLLGDHDAFTYGAGVGAKMPGFIVEGNYQGVSNDDNLIEFRGASYYTSSMLTSGGVVLKSGLDSYLLKVGYDFSHLSPNLKGLALNVRYSTYDYPDSGATASPDIDELQFDTIYKLSGALKGMRCRFRLSFQEQDESQGGVGDVTSFRAYLDYKF